VGPRAGLDRRNISSPPEFDPGPSSPVAQSLYRLSYRAHKLVRVVTFNTRAVINIQRSLRKASVVLLLFLSHCNNNRNVSPNLIKITSVKFDEISARSRVAACGKMKMILKKRYVSSQ